jgi:myo-inositol-1(or 4)-monophosphatase
MTRAPFPEDDLDLAIRAARSAGTVLMRAFGAVGTVRHKGPDQPVTDADLEADALLRDLLLGARPGDGWLSEETVDRPARLERQRVWIVDPLDGTRSFIGGYPEFAVSIALAVAGRAEVGVVYNPARAELFWATREGGAFRARPWQGGRPVGRRLRLASAAREHSRILASRSEIRRGEFEPFASTWRVSPLGSTAYKLARVGAGRGAVFLSRGPKSEWDVAAGALIVREAGGMVTDLAGSLLAYNRPDPYVHGVLAAPPALHRELMETIAGMPLPRLRATEGGSREEVE